MPPMPCPCSLLPSQTSSPSLQDKAEAKLQMLEQKAQEQQKARLAADEDWRHQQRERELARLKVCSDPLPSSSFACCLTNRANQNC